MRGPHDITALPTVTRPELTVRILADLFSRLFLQVNDKRFLAFLGESLAALVDFDNYIVFSYRDGHAAELVYTNLDHALLRQSMRSYINGLYLVDPFYTAATDGGRRGLTRMQEIAPETFTESDYFKMFYKNVNVIDEARFIVERSGQALIHLFLERETPNPVYSGKELEVFRSIQNLVDALIQQHWAWREMSASIATDERIPLTLGLRTVIGNMRQRALTAREIDIVELSLKGHAAKSIAQELGISEGTVINHKRNIYSKLDINSQSQLFHLFLQSLYESAPK
jgi:DNA-binding CsgD family transcriptional regulator